MAPRSRSIPEPPAPGTRTWRRPGGKLVEEGAHSLKQAELLAILIGTGAPGRPALGIANAILDQYVGFYNIHRQATLSDLVRIPGLGPRKAARILAALELGRRLRRQVGTQGSPPKSQADLFHSSLQAPDGEAELHEHSDASLLAEIIGAGIRGRPSKLIAEQLLARFGSFASLFGRDMGDFLEVKGLNSVKIIRIAAALEIAKRLAHALS